MTEDRNDTTELFNFRLKIVHGKARTTLAGLVEEGIIAYLVREKVPK